ncbi:MAG TPA: phosphoglucosamine mutase [bacterium]|nr:phosphoglucosamine mutase [bacterium]
MDKLIISISGIRGIYGKTLKQEDALLLGKAFGLWTGGKNIAIGRDTRLSGDVIKLSFMAGLLGMGGDVYDFGIVATPALTWFVEKTSGFYGSVITASHNPVDYNGIKLINSSGTFLNLKQSQSFFRIYRDIKNKTRKKPGCYCSDSGLMNRFFSDLLDCIDVSAIKKQKFKVVVDPVQGVGSLYSKFFLEMLGCDVVMINNEPPGVFSHNPEPVPSHLTQLSKAVKQEKADIGFAQDPDGDRLAMIANNGMCVSEEYGLAMLIYWMLKRKKGPVVVNIATTKLIDEICHRAKVRVFRSRVGEVCVVEKMKKIGATAGGEGNGGIILPEFHYGRDSFVGMALTLEMLAKTSLTLSEILKQFPHYYFIKKKIRFSQKNLEGLYGHLKENFSSGRISRLDGLRIDFDDVWFGIRPSGTEPIVRIFVEGKTRKKVDHLMKEIKKCINLFCKTV